MHLKDLTMALQKIKHPAPCDSACLLLDRHPKEWKHGLKQAVTGFIAASFRTAGGGAPPNLHAYMHKNTSAVEDACLIMQKVEQ